MPITATVPKAKAAKNGSGTTKKPSGRKAVTKDSEDFYYYIY